MFKFPDHEVPHRDVISQYVNHHLSSEKQHDNNELWNALLKHFGHNVEIVCYGDSNDPHDVCLECADCGCVILDAELYTIVGRSD